MAAERKPGRPLSSNWVETAVAVDELGISARQLRKIKPQLKPGFHYRVKNPKAARLNYLWHATRIADFLVPKEGLPGDRSEP